MSARATWKGVLKISLVTIPIKVYPATESAGSLSFNQLHATCQTRMQQKKWCPTCAREVVYDEIVKGFEFEPGKYVVLHDAEFDAVKPDSTRVIDLTQFADASELEPHSIDRSYYLAPDGPLAAEAFAVMLIALRHRVGIGKLAIYGREYLVAVRPTHVPSQPVLMLHTLHHAAELRPVDAIGELPSVVQAPADQVRLAQHVIAALLQQPLDLADFTDQYQVDLRRLIDAKIAGEEIVVPRIPDTPAVTNLHDALTQSLAAVRATQTVPAKMRLARAASPVTGKRRRA